MKTIINVNRLRKFQHQQSTDIMDQIKGLLNSNDYVTSYKIIKNGEMLNYKITEMDGGVYNISGSPNNPLLLDMLTKMYG